MPWKIIWLQDLLHEFQQGQPQVSIEDEKTETRSEGKDLSYEEQAETSGLVQPGKEKPLGKPLSSFPVLKGGLRKVGRDSLEEPVVIRQNDFKLKDGRFIQDTM